MTTLTRTNVRALITCLGFSIVGTNAQSSSVLDLFPASGLTDSSPKTESSCSFEFKPCGSTWVKGIDEKDVFLASMQGDGWTLGIGKGGHIYSLRSPIYGESVPPQRKISPWNDEVWQAVATNESIIGPIHEYHAKNRGNSKAYHATKPLMYFIHQAGIYTEGADAADSSKKTAFYSPLLRKH